MNVAVLVVERLGADVRQWRSLTNTMSKGPRWQGPPPKSWWRRLMGNRDLIPCGAMGLVLCSFAFRLPVISESSALGLSVFMLLIFLALLAERGESLSQDRMAQLRCFPISERTFFVCYLTGLVRRTAFVAALLATPTALAIAVREGAVPLLGWLVAAVLGACFVTFSLAALFTWSRGISPNRPWVGGTCLISVLVLFLAVVAVPFVVTRLDDNTVGTALDVLLWLSPPSWFSAFVDAANGLRETAVLLFAGIALASAPLAYVAMARAWIAYAWRREQPTPR